MLSGVSGLYRCIDGEQIGFTRQRLNGINRLSHLAGTRGNMLNALDQPGNILSAAIDSFAHPSRLDLRPLSAGRVAMHRGGEPIDTGGGKPQRCRLLPRAGSETVVVALHAKCLAFDNFQSAVDFSPDIG